MPGFLISKYEVTIFEYAKFLKYLETHPEQANAFDSPKQPKGKSHIPVGWADMKEVSPPNPGYYNRAKHWTIQRIPTHARFPCFWCGLV
jgi:formylglycine-generating enzyme required for sulfatase activity